MTSNPLAEVCALNPQPVFDHPISVTIFTASPFDEIEMARIRSDHHPIKVSFELDASPVTPLLYW